MAETTTLRNLLPRPRTRAALALLAGALLAAGCADGAGTSPSHQQDAIDIGPSTDTDTGADTADTTTSPGCGDDQVGGAELCDGADLNGQTCQSQGFGGGDLACNESCNAFVTDACTPVAPPSCGNARLDPETVEQCDGTDLNGQSCQTLGYEGGTLGCHDYCRFDLTGCDRPVSSFCGDGIVGGSEVCDGPALVGATCASEGFVGGVLACQSDCAGYDTGACTMCGNATVDSGEACDGSVPSGQSCQALGFDDGELACEPVTCQIDASGCRDFGCGDGVIDGNEECEGNNLDGASCGSQGFDGGTLRCTTNCRYDTALCHACGDATLGGPEVCDGTKLDGKTCQTQGFSTGTLACASDCLAFDTSACTTCGDGAIEGAEQCEGADLGGQTCVSVGFSRGTLACRNNCAFDTSACTTCGNALVESGELCEPSNLAGQTCQSLYFDSGTLSCSSDCTALDTSGCTRAPHPGVAQLVITEIMVDPTVLSDTSGEWFELHNPGASTLSINGCVIESTTSTGQVVSHTISGAPQLTAGRYLSLATAAAPGFTPDVVYAGSINFDNAAPDSLRLVCGGVTVDEVVWDGAPAFPSPSGASLSLSPTALSASLNDDGANWCIASTVYNTGGTSSDAGTPGAANTACSTLYFTEYVEGSASNKAVEIVNRGSAPFDIGHCLLHRYSNGGITASNILLDGTVAANDVFVLCHGSFSTPGLCDLTNTLFNVNGNDAFELVCAGQVLDVFGRIGEDPGTAWTNTAGTVSTADMTLRRKCTVTSGDTDGSDPFDPSIEWTAHPIDTLGGLGVVECP